MYSVYVLAIFILFETEAAVSFQVALFASLSHIVRTYASIKFFEHFVLSWYLEIMLYMKIIVHNT